MINPKELRIGSIIKHPRSDFGIIIETGEHNDSYYARFKDTHEGYYLDSCELIPLTEDILLKCGFEKIDSNAFHIDNLGQLFLENDSAYFYFNGKKIYVKYLHQLQNLYFALTNQELEIEL